MAYRSKVAGANTRSETENRPTENRPNDERLSLPPSGPFRPFPLPPWPWPGPGPTFPESGDRDAFGSAAVRAVSDPEVLKRIYCIPEYRAVIQLFASSLLQRLQADPEALLAFRDFLKAQSVDLDQQERFIPLLIAAGIASSFAAGCGLGYNR